MRLEPVGFDLSSESVKFIELLKKKEKIKIGRFAEVALPHGAISKGDIRDREILKKSLGEIRTKYDLKHVAVSLPEEKSYLFNITIPYVEPGDLRNTIELQLEEHIPIPPEQVQFDFEVIGYDGEQDALEINIAVLPTTIVTDYLTLIEESGYSPVLFGTEAEAVARAIIRTGDSEAVMIVDFGHKRTGFSIVHHGRIVFNTTLDFGGADITEAITKDFQISYAEAEKLKIEKGIVQTDTANDLFPIAFSSLAVLKDEVNKYYSYWNNRVEKESGKLEKISRIYFSGGGSALLGLGDFLTTYLEVPFQLANPWVNVIDIAYDVPLIHQRDSLKYATAIGLALTTL